MRLRVLLVEDDPATRDMCARAIRQHTSPAALLTIASEGDEATERMRLETPDLLITDQRLGGPTGVDLVRAFHRANPRGTSILMTGHFDEALDASAREAGATLVLDKPATVAELQSMLVRAIAHHMRDVAA